MWLAVELETIARQYYCRAPDQGGRKSSPTRRSRETRKDFKLRLTRPTGRRRARRVTRYGREESAMTRRARAIRFDLAGHRRRRQRRRHRPRRRRPRPLGRARARRTTSLQGTSLALRQAGPWRPALSRILRVPAGARGADRARGAAATRRRTSSGRCASCCRTRPSSARAWLVRLGLFLYDHLGGRKRLPGTPQPRPRAATRRRADPATTSRRGFEYSDCWVDDARLVVLNAVDAARARRHGAHPHGRVVGAPARTALWQVELQAADRRAPHRRARARARQCRRTLGRGRHRPGRGA